MKKNSSLVLLSLGHLLIDFCGIYLVAFQTFHMGFKYVIYFYIVYDVLAFGMQPLIGYYFDRNKQYKNGVIVGLLLALVAMVLKDIGIVAIIMTCIANGIYHTTGGALVNNYYPKKAAPLGFFVAFGAIGVFMGFKLAVNGGLNIYMILGITVFIMLFGLVKDYTKVETIIKKNFMKIVMFALIVVGVRGFVGSILLFPWKGELWLDLVLILGVFLGKALGGVLSDKFGFRKIGLISFISSLPLLILGFYYPALAVAGAILFNFTMGITLYIIMDSLGEYKGFAFGLTTLGLIIGMMPGLSGYKFDFGIYYISALTIAVIVGIIALLKLIKLYEEV